MSLSGKAKDILKIALGSRSAGKEVADHIENSAWGLVAQELSPGAAPSAAFVAALKKGDLVEAVDAAGATTFAACTADKAFPGLTVANGDLLKASRKARTPSQRVTGPDLFPRG